MNNNEAFFKIVNDQSDYSHIADYIIDNYNIDINKKDAIEIAKKMVNKNGCRREEVLRGETDSIIRFYLRAERLRQNSIRREEEPRKKSALKTIKDNIKKNWVKYVLVGTISISAIYAYTKIETRGEEPELTTSQMIGLIVAQPETDEELHKQSIVAQNTHHVPNTLDANGFPIPFYDTIGIAKDILKICENNPDLFNLCMNSVYFDMKINRLGNMDSVINDLEIYSKDREGLENIHDIVSNNKTTLDYILSTNLVEPTREMMEAINECKKVGYNNLSKDNQKEINAFRDLYQDAGEKLQEEYNDDLRNILGLDGEEIGPRTN